MSCFEILSNKYIYLSTHIYMYVYTHTYTYIIAYVCILILKRQKKNKTDMTELNSLFFHQSDLMPTALHSTPSPII